MSSTAPTTNPDRPRPPRPVHGHRRNLSTEVSETARLDVLVPHSSNIDIAAAIAASDSPKGSTGSSVPCVAHIKQRNHLFYDENLPVFVVLEILAPLDDALYAHYLARLAVSLEVTAVDSQQRPGHGNPNRNNHESVHMLFQTVVDEKKTPRIAVPNKRLSVWKLEVPLGHPKARLNNPRVVLTCSAVLRPADTQKPLFDDEYMTTRQPIGMNLLEPFADDPALAHAAPRLSALRVSRVIPASPAAQHFIRPLGYAAKRAFSIYPAINIRLRYNRIPTGGKTIVVASLDLEVTQLSECNVTIKSVNIQVAGGKAELLDDSPSTALPITCEPRDDITFLYHLTKADTGTGQAPGSAPNQHLRAVSVTLEATALVSEHCRPSISTNWTTSVDFAPHPAPQALPTPSAGLQRANRPPSLGAIVHGATVGTTLSASSGIRPAYQVSPLHTPNVVFTPPLEQYGFPNPNPSTPGIDGPLGLTVTFTGPSRVYVGEVFIWSVFVVNRSQRTRKLALVVPPKRKKLGEGKNLPPPPTSGLPDPVMEEGMVWQSHRSHYLEPAELVPLVNDLRIGPLMPSACHTAELRFVPLTTGLLSIEGIRVIDLNSNETTDCKDLPCIVSIARSTSLTT